jgi:serine-type D-Ala-D-Ala carboxypeptidase (penicillin-binding protein 5/6)
VTISSKKLLFIAGISVSTFGMMLSTSVASATTVNTQAIQKMNVPAPPSTQAKAVLVMDADNGQILYQNNADERRAPASTTKLMTMLLAFKAIHDGKLKWTDNVPITPDAYKVAIEPGVSDAYLDPKENFTMQDMMKFIAVLSANDATVAVADKIGGDKDSFVNMMNAEAKTLGLTGTHYMNPDGLQEDNHYTTARDLATLARYLVTNYPEVTQYASISEIQVRQSTQKWPNTDQLVGHYTGLDGLKTGFTSQAGYCFVGTAKQNGVRLVSVVLGDTSETQRFTDTKKLLDWSYQQFTETAPIQKGQDIKQTVFVQNAKHQKLTATVSEDMLVDLPSGTKGSLKLVSSDKLNAPIKQGDSIGTFQYVVNNQVIATAPAVASQDDGKANWFIRLLRAIGRFFGNLLHHL